MAKEDLLGTVTYHFFRPNGKIYEGTWVDNELNGEVMITMLGKGTMKTRWKNGVLISGMSIVNKM